METIGLEGSFLPFNSRVALNAADVAGKPATVNPYVNAGAMASASFTADRAALQDDDYGAGVMAQRIQAAQLAAMDGFEQPPQPVTLSTSGTLPRVPRGNGEDIYPNKSLADRTFISEMQTNAGNKRLANDAAGYGAFQSIYCTPNTACGLGSPAPLNYADIRGSQHTLAAGESADSPCSIEALPCKPCLVDRNQTEAVVKAYTSQCATIVTVKHLLALAGTLANNGVRRPPPAARRPLPPPANSI